MYTRAGKSSSNVYWVSITDTICMGLIFCSVYPPVHCGEKTTLLIIPHLQEASGPAPDFYQNFIPLKCTLLWIEEMLDWSQYKSGLHLHRREPVRSDSKKKSSPVESKSSPPRCGNCGIILFANQLLKNCVNLPRRSSVDIWPPGEPGWPNDPRGPISFIWQQYSASLLTLNNRFIQNLLFFAWLCIIHCICMFTYFIQLGF